MGLAAWQVLYRYLTQTAVDIAQVQRVGSTVGNNRI
jgi:hypothetical protein